MRGWRPTPRCATPRCSLCLLHEDLGLLRTVRVYSVEEYDRQRFDEHLERFGRPTTGGW